MKKMILSAMMMMAMMCFTTNVNAQDDNAKKDKKECCQKQEKKDCSKQKEQKDCCKKQEQKDCCKKCTECKPECGDKGCKECANNHNCKKNCKK